MDFRAFQQSRSWNINTIFKNSDLTPDIQRHLKKVYATLAAALFLSAVGALLQIQLHVSHTLCMIASFGSLIWLVVSSNASQQKRLLLLFAFTFFKGATLGPLISLAANIDPRILVTAFLGTVAIFTCFSLSAMLAARRSYLYLGGLLSSSISFLFILGLANMFFRFEFLHNVQLYGGLLVFVGYVIFDTQLIIERAANGRKDFIGHAMELFIDFVAIFVRILIILIKNSQQEKKNKN